MTRPVPFLSALACILMLAACTPGKPLESENPQVVASPDKVSMMLADAADRASVALETLAAVEQSRAPQATVSPIENAPAELKRAVTMQWVGPVEPLAKKLANHAGYSFQPIGTPPTVPLVVSVDVENKPVIDILRSVGLQLGARGNLHVDGRSKVVEIHYSPNTGLGG